MKSPIQVVMVEDHPDYREGISLALETQSDIILTHKFGTAEHALRVMQQNPCAEVLLLDLNLPEMSGLDAIPWFLKYCPGIKIVILSQSESEADILSAIHLGASGYLLKESTLEQIVDGIRTVVAGGSPLDPQVAKFILTTVQDKMPSIQDDGGLSKREIEILQLLSNGMTKKEVSDTLNIEVTTVATHVRRIYEKLEVPNAPAAIGKAFRTGILAYTDKN